MIMTIILEPNTSNNNTTNHIFEMMLLFVCWLNVPSDSCNKQEEGGRKEENRLVGYVLYCTNVT